MRIMRTENNKSYSLLLIKSALIVLSLFCTAFVGFSGNAENGLSILFLLPLSFSVACFFSQKAITYAKDSFGLLILYALMILRYLVSPVLITLSGSLVPNLSRSCEGISYAVFIMIIELFAVLISINIVWKPVELTKPQLSEMSELKLSLAGALLIILLVALIFYRGTLPNVIQHLTFGLNYSYPHTPLKTYDMLAVLTVKTFLFLIIVSWLSKKYHKAKNIVYKNIYFIFAIIITISNSVIYNAEDRGTMVMGAMASIAVLLYCFGQKVRKLLPIIALVGVIFVWLLFSYGTLGVRNGEGLLEKEGYISDLSHVAELYSNGVSTEAHAYDMYDTVASQINLKTHISELIKSNNIFTLPGLWIVRGWVEPIPPIQNLFNSTLQVGKAYILPNAGLAMYGGTQYLGWLIDIIFHFMIVAGIYFFYNKKQTTHDVSGKYLYSYCEMICGFALMNNLMIAVSLLSALPFLLFIMIKINALGRKIVIK